MQLFGDAIAGLALEPLRREEIRRGIRKFYVEPPPEIAVAPVPLRAVYMLESPQPGKAFQVERIPPLEAAQALLTKSYRRNLTLAFAGDGHHVGMTAAILRCAGVFRMHTPLGLETVPDTAARALSHWRRTH
jgi:hypothetical protein